MIYLNCNQLASSSSLTSTANCVVFEKIKEEYRSDEDITFEYILDTETDASSRNWIGLYPRDATRLGQYIALEWTIISPKDKDNRRQTITFHAKYHKKNIEVKKDYFFIFVNTQMKVIGLSSYFHFISYQTIEIDDFNVPEKLTTYNSSSPESLKSFCEENLKKGSTCVDKEVLQEFHYHSSHSNYQQMQLSSTLLSESSHRNLLDFKADVTLTSPDFPILVNPSNNNMHYCALCKRPTNFVEIEQSLNAKIKTHAEYGHTLKKRIEELEKNVEMSLVAQKQLRLIAYHAKREKLSYQKFVNEMCSVLRSKGSVRILDGHGTELLLKRIDNTQNEFKESTVLNQKSHREDILKSFISSQERTIKELTEKIENCASAKIREKLTEEREELIKLVQFESNTKVNLENNEENNIFQMNCSQSQPISKKNAETQQECINSSLNDIQENICAENTLNESYTIKEFEPMTVILPQDDKNTPTQQMEKFEANRNKYSYCDDGQGDHKPIKSTKNVHELKQNVMKELKNAILKRQDKTEELKHDSLDTISNESFSISINETVQSTRVEGSNALIIKGENLQYAVIQNFGSRIQQSS